MNYRYNFKIVKQILLEQPLMFNEIQKQRKENIYKER